MNLFGAFNFGKLIKTFLPGFVVLVGLSLAADGVFVSVSGKVTWLAWALNQPVFSSFASIPLSLICGILSNIVFFTFLTDTLIRRPFQKANAAFEAIQAEVLWAAAAG